MQRGRDHVDAVNRARRDTKFTTRAFVTDYGVHQFTRPDNGVDRAFLDTDGAANADRFIDYRDRRCGFAAYLRIEGHDLAIEQGGKRADRCSAPWGAAIYICVAAGNGVRVRLTAVIAAFATLRLWQEAIDLCVEGITAMRQPSSANAEACSGDDGKNDGNAQRGQHRWVLRRDRPDP